MEATRRLAGTASVGMALALIAGCSSGVTDEPSGGTPPDISPDETVTLTIESHRVDDADTWNDVIIPAFMAEHPEINVEFLPTKATEYDAALSSKFQAGTAGDLVVCRSGEISIANIEGGYLEPIDDLEGLANFDDLALSYWSDRDGNPFCVPMVGVSSGLFYNKAIFEELGLDEPETMGEFFDLLQTVKDDGQYTPLALGATSVDSWVLDRIVLSGLGQNYWKGEEGRQGLIDGSKKFTDPEFVDALSAEDSLAAFLPDGYASIAAADAKQLFALGQAAVLPTGSWDINAISTEGLDIGLFPWPVVNAGDQLYMQFHPDHGMGINAAGAHVEEARVFLEWVASTDFSSLYVHALPGFFSMSKEAPLPENALAGEFTELLAQAEVSPRMGHGVLMAGGDPDFVTQMTNLLQLMMTTDDTTPEFVAQQQQEQLESWYGPQQ